MPKLAMSEKRPLPKEKAGESNKPKEASSIEHEHSQHNLANLEIEIHHDKGGSVTGHTVHMREMPKKSKNGAFTEYPDRISHPFGADGMSTTHGHMLHHIAKHLGLSVPSGNKGMIEAENKEGEGDDDHIDGNAG